MAVFGSDSLSLNLVVIFILFPSVIWTGLATSPAIASAFPPAVTQLGGQQSARTLHFEYSGEAERHSGILFGFRPESRSPSPGIRIFRYFRVADRFVIVHVVMVWRGGFKRLMRGMIPGAQ